MEDKEAIVVLERMLDKFSMTADEQEAIRCAIGVLGWSKLAEGSINNMKQAHLRRFGEGDL